MNHFAKDLQFIRELLSQEELLCQLAEEAAELSKAALKLRRVYDGSNPTPVKRSEAFNNLKEEVADVTLCIMVADLDKYDTEYAEICGAKLKRWATRLREARLDSSVSGGQNEHEK